MNSVIQFIKPAILSIFLIAILPAFYLSVVLTIGLFKPYSWHVMDWNNNGATSIGEILYAADTSTRDVQWQNQTCIEIFVLKDGLKLKLKCGQKEIGPDQFDKVVR